MRPRQPDKAKLTVSLFTKERLFAEVLAKLQMSFGPPDLLSEELEFGKTDYYEEEFGGGLKRKIASFERLIDMDELAGIKILTNGVEDEYLAQDKKRRVNIDPGYMTLDKFVLASCKNFSHRIYIGRGVFADLTLMYHKTDFKDLPWTFPDYREEGMKAVLREIRKRYALQTGKGLRHG